MNYLSSQGLGSRYGPGFQSSGDPSRQFRPIVQLPLAKQTNRRIPGAVIAIAHPSPVRVLG